MTEKPHAEEAIWRPISENPEALGFPNATALNHLQMGDQSGYIDLVLFPAEGPSLVLIEAKHAADSRSAADSVGQLVKYYTHALSLGSDGLAILRTTATASRSGSRPSRLLSLKSIFAAGSQAEAQTRAGAGMPIRPQDVALVIAVDQVARKFEQRLFRTVEALDHHHGLSIGVAVVQDGRPRWHRPWRPSRSVEKTG
jgi:hypothetical protein